MADDSHRGAPRGVKMAESLKLEGFVRTLENWGLTDVMLPFLLIFVIVYAILQKTKILGEGKKNLNAVVAIVMGALVVIPHVTGRFPREADPVIIINDALPQISIVLVAIVFLLVLIGAFGQDMVLLGMTMPGWILFTSIAIIVITFGSAAGWWSEGISRTLEDTFGTDALAIGVMLLVFGLLIAWITSEPKEEKSILNKAGVDLGKLFGKK